MVIIPIFCYNFTMTKENNRLYPQSTDFCTLDYECAYLDGKSVRMNYKYVRNSNMDFNSAVIERGWRRFGNYYFYPICNGCNECKSLRIDVENFKPSKSQRKALNRNKNTTYIIQKPTVTIAHVNLYNKYHAWRSKKSNWKEHSDISKIEYYENFAEGAFDFGKEVLYYIDNKLVGVDLIDITNDGISSIYFYYDPDYERNSLGIYSLVKQVEFAKILNKKWIYLGYWVDGCRSFEYKAKFKPLEILDGFPDIKEAPAWKEFK